MLPASDAREESPIVRFSVNESPFGACKSQSLTVLSRLADARVRLTGEKLTPMTLSRWRRVERRVIAPGAPPVVARSPDRATTGASSQTFTVRSQLAEASQRLSGLKA